MSGLVIAVLARDAELTAALELGVRAWAGRRSVPGVEVLSASDPATLIDALDETIDEGAIVPIILVELYRPDDWGQNAAIALRRHELTEASRTVLVTSKVSLHGVDAALAAGAVQGVLTRPWSDHGLARLLEANVATFLVEHAPERLDDVAGLFEPRDLELARQRVEQQSTAVESTATGTHPLLDQSIDDRELEAELVELLDDALGHPPRVRLSPGTVLIEAGEDVGGFYVILDGTVRLTSRTDTGERVTHERSTGAIVGLLSLATRRRALQRSQAVTEVRAIPITLDQLARAFDAAPELSGVLTRVLIGSLARRLRRSDQLQVELDESLAALSEARAQLVASARFATLGELSAGLAHELNNPTAALGRTVEHLLTDLMELIDDPSVAAAVAERYSSEPDSTASMRRRRREVLDAVGDPVRADQLVAAGATDAADARNLAALDDDELRRLASARTVGGLLRNVTNATERIQTLVGSLRAYARGDDGKGPFVEGIDVEEGVHHAIGLLSHRSRDAEITVATPSAALPSLTASPGALQQVWTNLLANALDATGDRGRIDVTLDSPDSGHVRVRVTDDGPGVPDELLPRIFEPRFTTKDGTVRFGLGLGLSISRQLVAEHGGSIDVESRPGATTFTVMLPTSPPDTRPTARSSRSASGDHDGGVSGRGASDGRVGEGAVGGGDG